MAITDNCFWCGGNKTLHCVLCDKEIPCMICKGTGVYTAGLDMEPHVCPQALLLMEPRTAAVN